MTTFSTLESEAAGGAGAGEEVGRRKGHSPGGRCPLRSPRDSRRRGRGSSHRALPPQSESCLYKRRVSGSS